MPSSLNRSFNHWRVHFSCRRANLKTAVGFILYGCLWAADGPAIAAHPATKAQNQPITSYTSFAISGYAASCPRLPKERAYDAVRFSIARDRGAQLQFWFVCESGHRPAVHGMLEYDLALGRWVSSHPDRRIQKMAECYLQSYLLRRVQPASADFTSSPIA